MESKQMNQSGSTVLVRGRDLPISTKKAVVLCKLLKNKKIESSLKLMEGIVAKEKGISLNRREALKVGDRGKKYPIKTAQHFVKLLKSLSANANVKGIDSSRLILMAKADKASSPLRPGARLKKFKRTHVLIQGKLAEGENKK